MTKFITSPSITLSSSTYEYDGCCRRITNKTWLSLANHQHKVWKLAKSD